jgi:hypothetical protein
LCQALNTERQARRPRRPLHETLPLALQAYPRFIPAVAAPEPVGKIRRWLKGYDFKSGERLRHSDAVWQGELRPIENKLALSFRDLLELRFVDAFISAGVSWRTMRRAHSRAQIKLKTTHPFCSNRIFTDGRSILLRQGEEDSDRVLIDLANDQAEFARIVEPFRKELEFSGSDIIWWPLGKERQILSIRNAISVSPAPRIQVCRHACSPAA